MGKVLLAAPLWLDSPHEDSMKRNTKWLNFMIPLKDKLGYDEIFLVDNASTKEKVDYIANNYQVTIHRCKKHISRREHLKYGYYYAALAIIGRYALDNNYDKIVYIDTDMFPLTNKMCEYTKNITSGWIGLWCHRHKFPETLYQIIGKDKLQDFYDFHFRDFLSFYPDLDAESQTPFTHVEKGLNGDRFGEMDGINQDTTMDYFGQARVEQTFIFNMAPANMEKKTNNE